MVVIRRMIDRHCAYTAILLPGTPPKSANKKPAADAAG
jgi:hypothetical protein